VARRSYFVMMDTMQQLLQLPNLSQVKRYWLTIAFILGFVVDLILLNRIDSLVDNLILLANVTIATVAFVLLYVASSQRIPEWLSRGLYRYAPILMQYGFGGLLSGMLIFYGRSGDFFANAPFLLIIIAVIFGNEFIVKRSDKLIYHIALYYIGIFSYSVLVLPVLLGRMGDLVFIVSGAIALLVVILLVKLLALVIPNFIRFNLKRIIVTIGFIYLGFNTLYFSNLIPPIPLSLTHIEIAHGVVRSDDGRYRVTTEEQPWWRAYTPLRPILNPSQSYIACFARVYAPTRLTTNIYHHWEYKNESGQWVERFRLSYPISHSNIQGYRGYTQIANFTEGVWRCSVKTARGQVLGREVVIIDTNKPRGELVTRVE
jgi:hypothetical protein